MGSSRSRLAHPGEGCVVPVRRSDEECSATQIPDFSEAVIPDPPQDQRRRKPASGVLSFVKRLPAPWGRGAFHLTPPLGFRSHSRLSTAFHETMIASAPFWYTQSTPYAAVGTSIPPGTVLCSPPHHEGGGDRPPTRPRCTEPESFPGNPVVRSGRSPSVGFPIPGQGYAEEDTAKDPNRCLNSFISEASRLPYLFA